MKKGDKVKLREYSQFYSQCPGGIGTITQDDRDSKEFFYFRVKWLNNSNNYREIDLELFESCEPVYDIY